jgi:hypothetical protein
MRKLKLDLEKLEVTSFGTDGEGGTRGTVAGRGNQEAATGIETCANYYTCFSCGGTCGGTCQGIGGVCGSWPMTFCAACGDSGAGGIN